MVFFSFFHCWLVLAWKKFHVDFQTKQKQPWNGDIDILCNVAFHLKLPDVDGLEYHQRLAVNCHFQYQSAFPVHGQSLQLWDFDLVRY
jgi:hypothetical protein